jgi:hypothetical protein
MRCRTPLVEPPTCNISGQLGLGYTLIIGDDEVGSFQTTFGTANPWW